MAVATVSHHRRTHVFVPCLCGVSPGGNGAATLNDLVQRTGTNKTNRVTSFVRVPRCEPPVKGLNREAAGPHMLGRSWALTKPV